MCVEANTELQDTLVSSPQDESEAEQKSEPHTTAVGKTRTDLDRLADQLLEIPTTASGAEKVTAVRVDVQELQNRLSQLGLELERTQGIWDNREYADAVADWRVKVHRKLHSAGELVTRTWQFTQETSEGDTADSAIATEMQSLLATAELLEQHYDRLLAVSIRFAELREHMSAEFVATKSLTELLRVCQETESFRKIQRQSIGEAMLVTQQVAAVRDSVLAYGDQWADLSAAVFLRKRGPLSFPQGVYEKILQFAAAESTKVGENCIAKQALDSVGRGAVHTMQDLERVLRTFGEYRFTVRNKDGEQVVSFAQIRETLTQLKHDLKFTVRPDGSCTPNEEELKRIVQERGIPIEHGLAAVITTALNTETAAAQVRNELQHPENIKNLRELFALFRIGRNAVRIETQGATFTCLDMLQKLDRMLLDATKWAKRKRMLGLYASLVTPVEVQQIIASYGLPGDHVLLKRIAALVHSEVESSLGSK